MSIPEYIYDQPHPPVRNLLDSGYSPDQVITFVESAGRTCLQCTNIIHWSRPEETLCPDCLSGEYSKQC